MLNNKTVLRGLRNIGPTIADRRDTVGLNTVGDLKRNGPAKAFKLIKGAYPDVTTPAVIISILCRVPLKGNIGTL